MPTEFGYLLPTREHVMEDRPAGRLLLELARHADDLGFDSVWVGDSLLARPRHEPMTLLAAVAGQSPRLKLGTAVLLPALRNPVLLAHQAATVDQVSEGRLILGVGIAADTPAIRAEFKAAGVPYEKRVGRLMEGLRLCKALWTGESISWNGRWEVDDQTLGPIPHRAGGPPIWLGTSSAPGLNRAGRHFDGWFPTGPDAATFGERWQTVRDAAHEAGRNADELTASVYLTVSINEDADAADAIANDYLQRYYQAPAAVMRKHQAVFAGPAGELGPWIQGYVDAGATHIIVRFAGDHDRHLKLFANVREEYNW
ncbi:MAG: LLM class flavin-dependent oxidoreductase [Pseudomonadota bacterium]